MTLSIQSFVGRWIWHDVQYDVKAALKRSRIVAVHGYWRGAVGHLFVWFMLSTVCGMRN